MTMSEEDLEKKNQFAWNYVHDLIIISISSHEKIHLTKKLPNYRKRKIDIRGVFTLERIDFDASPDCLDFM